MLPCTGKLPFAGILLFHFNLPRTAFGSRFGNLTLTTNVGKTCLCELQLLAAASASDAPPAEIDTSEYQESTGLHFHIVSVNFHASVLIINVLSAGGWLATLAKPPV